MKTWLEEYLYQCTCYEGERIASKTAIEEVCKKILEEVDHQVEVGYDTTEAFVIGKNQLRDIIIDLGVKV